MNRYTLNPGLNNVTPGVQVRINHNHPQLQGLQAWYRLAEGGGIEIIDSSRFGRDGVFLASKWVDGGPFGGQVPDFEGSASQNVDVSQYTPPIGNMPRTITGWIYPRTTGLFSQLVSYGALGAGEKLTFGIRGGGIDALWVTIEDTRHDFNTLVWTPGQWQFIALTFEGTTLAGFTGYLDGAKEVASGTSTVNTLPGAGLYLGYNEPNASQPWDGRFQDVRIYDRKLSDEEIQDVRLFPFAAFYTPIKRVLFQGSSLAETEANSTGTSTASAVGVSTSQTVAASDGVSTAQAESMAVAEAQALSDGAGAAQAEGTATVGTVAESGGTSTAQATGLSTAETVANASASAQVLGEVSSTHQVEFSVAGTASVEGQTGTDAEVDANASGTSTALAVSASVFTTVAESDGTSTAQASGLSIAQVEGSANGTATATGISESAVDTEVDANASGSSTVLAQSSTAVNTGANAAGIASVFGISNQEVAVRDLLKVYGLVNIRNSNKGHVTIREKVRA